MKPRRREATPLSLAPHRLRNRPTVFRIGKTISSPTWDNSGSLGKASRHRETAQLLRPMYHTLSRAVCSAFPSHRGAACASWIPSPLAAHRFCGIDGALAL